MISYFRPKILTPQSFIVKPEKRLREAQNFNASVYFRNDSY